MPSSIRSAPAAGSFSRMANDVSASGSPAVMNGMKAARSSLLQARRTRLARLLMRLGITIFSPSACATVNTSLSPRPDRQTAMILSLSICGAIAHDMGDRMRGFQRRDDAFELGKQHEGFQRLAVGGGEIFHAARILQPGMLRPDAGIIQPRRNRMGFQHLAVADPATDRNARHAARRACPWTASRRDAAFPRPRPPLRRRGFPRRHRRGRDGTCRWHSSRRRRRRRPDRAAVLRAPASARASRCRSRSENRAPSRDRDAGRPPSR